GIWSVGAELLALFNAALFGGAGVLVGVLGEEFDGVLGCDCFSAYRRFMRECGVVVQFCLAHLIRDVKFLTTLPGRQDRSYGERLREALRQLFRPIPRREERPPRELQVQLGAGRAGALGGGATQ